jgi:hypothetical protein
MQLIVQVRPQLATALAAKSGKTGAPANARTVLQLVRKAGASLRPQAPADGAASTFFTVEGADEQALNALAAQIRAIAGVEAAYLKPADEPP